MPYLSACIGGVSKFIKKGVKKVAIIDSFRAASKIVFEEQSLKMFVNSMDAFIVLNDIAKNDLIAIRPDALYRQHPRPFWTGHKDSIEQSFARKVLNLPRDGRILLYWGDVRQYRGIDSAIVALSKLSGDVAGSDYHLLVAGQSPSGLDYYKKMVYDLGVVDRVTFIERQIHYSEVPYFFYASDVLLLLSQNGVSRSEINEIFRFDLPFIAFNSSSGASLSYEEIREFGIFIDWHNDAEDNVRLVGAIDNYFKEGMRDSYRVRLSGMRYDSSWDSLSALLFELYDKLLDNPDTVTIF